MFLDGHFVIVAFVFMDMPGPIFIFNISKAQPPGSNPEKHEGMHEPGILFRVFPQGGQSPVLRLAIESVTQIGRGGVGLAFERHRNPASSGRWRDARPGFLPSFPAGELMTLQPPWGLGSGGWVLEVFPAPGPQHLAPVFSYGLRRPLE